jgi:hypothetical protein
VGFSEVSKSAVNSRGVESKLIKRTQQLDVEGNIGVRLEFGIGEEAEGFFELLVESGARNFGAVEIEEGNASQEGVEFKRPVYVAYLLLHVKRAKLLTQR